MDQKKLDLQSQHWEASFLSKPEMFGLEPSIAAAKALKLFQEQNIEKCSSNISDNILAYAVTGTLSSDYPVTFPNPVIEFGDISFTIVIFRRILTTRIIQWYLTINETEN